MSKDWKIENGTMVHGGPNKTQLIGCSIKLDPATNAYGFFGPDDMLEATVAPDAETGEPAKPPFNFPVFRSSLNGTAPHEWYILVKDLDYPTPDLVDGKWSNKHYPLAGLIPDPDLPPPPGNSDTYTAQAGIGVDPGEKEKDKKKEKEAAAHASAKL